MRITFAASDAILLQDPNGATMPSAKSCVDVAIGEASGHAAYPYPGETVLSAPGIALAGTGQSPPDLPTYVSSTTPTRESQEVEQPGYLLRSESRATSSRSTAVIGVEQDPATGAVTRAETEATVDPGEGSASATARSVVQPLVIAGVLELGTVRSEASAVVRPDGTVRRRSDLRLGRSTVGGTTVELTPEGFVVSDDSDGGDALPDSVTAPELPGDALQQLADAGISLRYIEEARAADRVRSAGFELRVQQTDPQSGARYTEVLTFGLAYARAEAPEPTASDEDVAEPAEPSTSASGSDSALPATPGTRSGSTGGTALPPDAAPVADAPAAAAAPTSTEAELLLVENPGALGATQLYLLLVFGAVMTVVSSTVLRVLGVKSR